MRLAKSKIFSDVRNTGAKVVMKNNMPECVLLSPEEYVRLIDMANDAELLTLATERLKKIDPSKFVPEGEVYKKLGVTEADMQGYEEVE